MLQKFFFKKYIVNFFLFLFYLILLSLHGCSNSSEPQDLNNKFGIYLLEDQNITWENLQNKKLDSLKLKKWITGDKIDFYDYSSHVIYLNVDYNTLFSVPHNNNTPFVVVANNKICYCGCFAPPKDTTQPHVVIKPLELCDDMVMLEFNPPNRRDIRVNENVKNALSEMKKFKPGFISSFFSDIYVHRSNGDTLRARIGFDIKNIEDRRLYIPSSANYILKTGNHSYISKIVFYNENIFYPLDCYIPSRYTTYTINAAEMLYLLGFTAIKPSSEEDYFHYCGSLNNFPFKGLPNGNYNCYCEFYGMMGGEKSRREAPEGRIWIGYLRTATMNFDYDTEKGITTKKRYVALD